MRRTIISNDWAVVAIALTVSLSVVGVGVRFAADDWKKQAQTISRLPLTEKLLLVESGARNLICKSVPPPKIARALQSVPPEHNALVAVLASGQCDPGLTPRWEPVDLCTPLTCSADELDLQRKRQDDAWSMTKTLRPQ